MIYNGWKEKWQEDAMEKDLRRLVIKAFHVRDVSYGEENRVTPDGVMTVDEIGRASCRERV